MSKKGDELMVDYHNKKEEKVSNAEIANRKFRNNEKLMFSSQSGEPYYADLASYIADDYGKAMDELRKFDV